MLPKIPKNGVALGLLLLCASSGFVSALSSSRSNPINCYHCDSVDECALGKGTVHKCQDNDAQTCLTIFDDSGVVSRRGCSDEVLATYNSYCASNAEKCPSCVSSGCNDAKTLSQFVECLSCDSALDKNCVLKPSEITTKKLCANECSTALYANAETTNPSYHLVRSCLNDFDLDDQALCLGGTDDRCMGCYGANCNVHAVPETRHSCYHCAGDECEDPELQDCVNFKEHDQCYMRIDDTQSVVQMGCLSDYENEEDIVKETKKKSLLTCEGINCNGFDLFPLPNDCVKCSSDSLEACSTKPTTLIGSEKCTHALYKQCYQRINGTQTERGCMADLADEDFYNCLTTADADKCKICTGDACNEEIIPADRPRCQRCNSASDVSCETVPAAVDICPAYAKDDSCVAVFENGVTKRGCLSEFSCDASAKNCQICKGTGCNADDLKRRVAEVHGAFQDLPLNCNTCTGAECLTDIRNPQKCNGDIFQDCMTVFDVAGVVVRRGCESLVRADFQTQCDAQPELCFNCKSNGCNTLTDASTFMKCLYCDAATNPECRFNPAAITNTRKCVEGCVSSLYPRKSDPDNYEFVRTCFEDIEADDRASCTADSNCVKCSDAASCNTDIVPVEGRLSCLHCNGADCDAPVAKQCNAFSPNDQCYMYYNNVTYSRMGCKSDLLKVQLLAEIRQIFLCDGNNCNTESNLPEAKTCVTCDSATDENCAVNPSKVSSQSTCENVPYTDCFTRVRSDGHTERGCLYKLPVADFTSCQNGASDAICNLCTENDCNNAVFPANRPQCQRCNSADDAACEAKPNHPQSCPLYKSEDSCITKLVAGITYRDCASELDCEDSNRKSCRTCNGESCNILNLSEGFIGDPGIFQALPLNCYDCYGLEECGGTSLGLINKCEGNKLQTCTVAFAADGQVVRRGCSDQLESACERDGVTCHDCKSSGCNSARQETDLIDCVFCDAQQEDSCTFDVSTITRTRKCHKSCMTALYPRTKDSSPVYELIRTCLDDMDMDDREACAEGKDANCKACASANCNKDDLGERKSCLHCVGENCDDPKEKKCRATMQSDQCFVEYDETGAVVEMGCKSKYDPSDVMTLLLAKRLWLCAEDNCNTIENTPVAQSCAICSSRTDANCAILPSTVSSTTTCAKLPFTECYSRINEDGNTERGCLSSLEGDAFYSCLNKLNATECLTCVGEKCNVKIHPSERLSCHVCRSDSTNTCESLPESQQICLKYSNNERCVSTLNEDGITVRGCSSQVTCDSKDTSNCQICDGDDCNRANLRRRADGKPGMWQELPLICRSCADEEACKQVTAQESCVGDNYCMTVFGDNGAVISLGCSNTVESKHSNYCDLNSDKCHNCNSYNCNTATNSADYTECVYCDSETNSNCISNPSAVGSRRKCNGDCMTALYPRANSSVYDLTRTCLDDKNVEDQKICRINAYCAACTGVACNIASLPADRLSCYTCKGDDCEDPTSAQCQSFKSEDKCYMLFNSQSSVVQMGCVSDLEDAFVANNAHLLYTCADGDDCNGFENIPTTKLCAVCSSKDDERCASSPENSPNVEQCTTLPNTQCYTRVNNGITERGCVSSLSKNLILSCLSGNSADCTTCLGDKCNVDIYPADRRRCHNCNTKDDPTCESSPNAVSICPFYSTNEQCAVKLVNGHTYRGCSSEFICDDNDKQYCRMCADGDNCNTVDLVSTNIGYPGKWQGVPINCYTCFGEECHGESLGLIRKCENNNLQNCATVFAANGTVVQRGCSDQVYANEFSQYCDSNPSFCKFCKSSGCNLPKNLNDFVDCIYCDGADNTDCVFQVDQISRSRNCHKKCLTGLYPRVNEVNPAYELARGCLDDLDLDDRDACESGDKANCVACTGVGCNKVLIPDTPRKQCYKCNGIDCEEPTVTECSSFRENDQCFTFFDTYNTNSVQRMGCASDLDTSFIHSNRRQLILCNADNCNTFENIPKPTGCSSCSSNVTESCATNPTRPGVAVGCDDLPYTQCYTHIDKAGVTIRGCLSDVADDVFDECTTSNSKKCSVCDSANCNNQVFPADRRSCNRCDSNDDADCEDNGSKFSGICPYYNEKEACVTKVEDARTLRGCSSELTCNNNDTCRICETDNCNTVNLLAGFIGVPGKWQALPLSCYVCEGEGCTGQNGAIFKCEGNNLQTCMTVFGTDGTTVQKRGCSDAVAETHTEYCNNNSDKCLACKSSVCNNAASLSDYVDCYFCDSADSSKCSVNFAPTTKTRKCQKSCMVALYPRSSSADPAYEMSRSCLDDMDLEGREACAAGNLELCEACEGSRCNTMAVPAERHECYKCIGDDCEDVETQQCSAYHPNDECYILFDDENSIANMGCRSEMEIDAVTELIKQKKIILCAEKNCNKLETIPTPKTCSACSSDSDPRCATNPNLVGNTERCAALPYTECYTLVNENGLTQRGCLSSLASESFYGCLTGADGLCETCVGDKCNEIDVFPVNRLKCHQCNSALDPLCSATPNSNTICPVYSASDSCVTSLHDGITKRGCSSNMKCQDQTDKRNCRICNTPGCNTANLEKVSEDGEPGRWQSVPLTCYHCKGEEECSAGSGTFWVCESNPFQNCMTVFNDDGKVIQRGCSDVAEAENQALCDADAGKCLGCTSNGCNMAKSLDDYVECLACDTDANGDCVNNVEGVSKTRKCYKHCMTALYPREQEENPAYGLSRSCYDDMDLDDRDACAAGNKEHCSVCSGAKCNNDAMPAVRLSCNVCDGDDCQDAKQSVCPSYRENDKCYIRYDETNSVSSMGCRSQFSNADADYLLKEKRLFLCEGDNCNTFAALPVAQSCAICNSRTDSKCATHPEDVTSVTTCSILPITECYSRVLSDGATERGCLSNLVDDEFLGCLNGSSTTCAACKGDKCNNKVHPTDRLTCHICDSSVDPNCEEKPASIGVCPKYDAADTCVTAFRSAVTYRGCSSSVLCDATNPRSCVKCEGSACNTVNLAQKQDDNFGKWQDLPLRCLTCVGEGCSSEASKLTCNNNNEQDCVTVFDASGKVIQRGCSDAVEEVCNVETNDCYNCKSNECNTAEAKTDFVDCIYCNSYKDLDCIWNPLSDKHKSRKCQGGCMTALYASDSGTNATYDLVRTCLNDKDDSDQTTCSADKDANCKACTAANCNVAELPENRFHCMTCIGDTCEDPVSKACELHKENDQCFTWFDETNSINQMGCVSSFRNQELESIIKTKRIYVCDGADCNTFDKIPTAQKCAVCDSKSDVNCAINALAIADFNNCQQLPYTSCYSKLANDGTTQRGCLTDLPADDFAACVLGKDENCGICTEDGCNREVFPADRLQCHTCTSDDDATCESFPTRKQACPVFTAAESCTSALGGNVTVRGCSSEIFCDTADKSTCRSCNATSCNAIDLRNKVDDGYHGAWQTLPLKCHTCEGEHCQHSLGPALSCANSTQQDCMTVFYGEGDGGIRRRGCADDVEDYEDRYCRENPKMCFKCKSNECNAAWSISEYVECAFCNSETDPLCAINPENAGFATRSCLNECMVAIKDGEVVRSCLDDKELLVQHVCRADETGKECASCDGNTCNKFVYPADRLKCHVCTGATCSNSVGQYCRLYDETDFCFAKFDSGAVEFMGCASSQNSSDIDKWTAQNLLYRCDGNDCNELSKLPKGNVCVSCDSNKTPQCAQNPLDVTSRETCDAPHQECVTRINPVGHTLRGCLYNMGEAAANACKADGTCAVCTGATCNTDVFPADRRVCHICNSAADTNCAKQPNSKKICPIYAKNDRCVSKRDAQKYVERGCASNFVCNEDDKNNCEICEGDSCNTADLSDSAGFASSSLLLTLLLATLAILGLNRN